jgi:hypothetical protein
LSPEEIQGFTPEDFEEMHRTLDAEAWVDAHPELATQYGSDLSSADHAPRLPAHLANIPNLLPEDYEKVKNQFVSGRGFRDSIKGNLLGTALGAAGGAALGHYLGKPGKDVAKQVDDAVPALVGSAVGMGVGSPVGLLGGYLHGRNSGAEEFAGWSETPPGQDALRAALAERENQPKTPEEEAILRGARARGLGAGTLIGGLTGGAAMGLLSLGGKGLAGMKARKVPDEIQRALWESIASSVPVKANAGLGVLYGAPVGAALGFHRGDTKGKEEILEHRKGAAAPEILPEDLDGGGE